MENIVMSPAVAYWIIGYDEDYNITVHDQPFAHEGQADVALIALDGLCVAYGTLAEALIICEELEGDLADFPY